MRVNETFSLYYYILYSQNLLKYNVISKNVFNIITIYY